jgi:Avidin family
MKSIPFALATCSVFSWPVAVSAQSQPRAPVGLIGTQSAWQNESGSTMLIDVDTLGNVTGSYVNRASGTGCQFSPYPISGRINGNFIAFSVSWENQTANCHSVTAWAGFAAETGTTATLKTRWNIAYQGLTRPAIAQGEDTFTLMSKQNLSAFVDGEPEVVVKAIRR